MNNYIAWQATSSLLRQGKGRATWLAFGNNDHAACVNDASWATLNNI